MPFVAENITALRNFKPPLIEDIEAHIFEGVILGQLNQIAHGSDHLRNEHLKNLIGHLKLPRRPQ